MTWSNFYQQVADKIESRQSSKAIWLKPTLDCLPLPIQRFDEPFLPLSKSIIKATNNSVSVYIFDLASYLAIGAAGIVALERAIAYANQDAITILHGPFFGKQYKVLTEDQGLNVNSLTVATDEDLTYYIDNSPYSAFLYNGTLLKDGGVMSDNTLTLFSTNYANISIEIIDTNFLLQNNLSDTYIETVKSTIA